MNAAAYHRSDRLAALNPFNQSRPRAPAPAPTEAPDLLSCSTSSSATAKQRGLQTRASLLRLRHRRCVGVSGTVAVAGTTGEQSLAVLVHRLALLDERRHALGAIFQRKGCMKQIALDIHALGQRGLEGAV